MFRHLQLLLVLVFAVTAARGQYHFDSWTTDNGLPQNGVRGITQTPDGYLWFTTFDGLVRFDGVKFTVFNKSNSPGIDNNRFVAVVAARDGTLWAATETGDLVVRRVDGAFRTIPADLVPGKAILGFRENPDGEMLINVETDFYTLRGDEFVHAGKTGQDNVQKQFCEGANGRRWEVYSDHTLEVTPGGTREYKLAVKSLMFYGSTTFEDSGGGLWVSDIGLLHHLKDGQVRTYGKAEGVPQGTQGRLFWEESDGSIWFATGSYTLPGVGMVRFKDGRFTVYGAERGLSNDRILYVFRDREANIWLATDKGLNRFRRQVVTSLSTAEGLDSDEVYPILHARDGSVYVGTIKGVNRIRDGVVTSLPLASAGRRDLPTLVQSLWEDEAGRLWVGGSGRLWLVEEGRIRDLSSVVDYFWTVNAITSDGTDILLGTQQNGVVRLRDGKVAARYTTAEGLASNDVKFIIPARGGGGGGGGFWVGTYGGLSRLVCEAGECGARSFTTADGLPSNLVRAALEDPDGTLWIGTYDGGLSRFRDGKFFNFGESNGLFSNGVFAIAEDAAGNFWMSSNNGIFRASRLHLERFADGRAAQYDSVGYGKPDGMLNAECNGGRQPAVMKASDGRIWFPTLEGVAIVNPQLIESNASAPPVKIETIAVDRAEVDPNAEVRISPQQSYLDIVYTAPSFIKSDQIRFRYRLEGLDPDWIDAGTRRSVNYAFLPPGEYVFVVTAASVDGVWNADGSRIRVVVEAPYYRRPWFWILSALIVAAVLLLIYRLRIRQLQRESAARELFSRHLIDSQENERKRIAQELHDGLGQSLLVIKNRALLGLETSDAKSSEQLGEIRDAATDALGEVRAIAYNLRPLHLERLGLSATIEEVVEDVEAASGITMTVYVDRVDDLFTRENEIIFYRIVQESLNNIVKHSGATRASVTVERDDRRVTLTVRDDGRGYDPSAPGFRAGLGLEGIAERVRLLGGRLSIDSTSGTKLVVEIDAG